MLNPHDSTQYSAGTGWKTFHFRPDTLSLAGMDSSLIVTQRFTDYGPVVSEQNDSSEATVVHWAGFDMNLSSALDNAFALATVGDFAEFRKVVTGLGALDANMMYADSAGNIGYQLTTPIAVNQNAGDVFASSLSQADSNHLQRYLPLARTPNDLNPKRGWIANCNNSPSRSTTVPGFFFATRILSIADLLQSKEKFSVDDMYRFQMSRTDRYLLRLKPEFSRIATLAGDAETAQLMDQWDGSTDEDSKATALVNVYLEKLREFTFKDELGSLWHQVPSKWIEEIRSIDSAGWFDDIATPGVVETYDTIAVRAMQSAETSVRGRTWGELQSFNMQHPMATIPILSSLLHLSTPEEPWGGTPGALDASFYRTGADDKFQSMAGPSWRFVVDFADVDKATMVIPAGVSGNPMTSHFLDFYPLWKSGKRWPVPFHHDPVMARAASVLTLVPASVDSISEKKP